MFEAGPGERDHNEGDGHYYYVSGEGENIRVRSIVQQTFFDNPFTGIIAILFMATLLGWPLAGLVSVSLHLNWSYSGAWFVGLGLACAFSVVIEAGQMHKRSQDDARVENVRRKLVAADVSRIKNDRFQARVNELAQSEQQLIRQPFQVAIADARAGGPGLLKASPPPRLDPKDPEGIHAWQCKYRSDLFADAQRQIKEAQLAYRADKEAKTKSARDERLRFLEPKLLDMFAAFAYEVKLAQPTISTDDIIKQFARNDVLRKIAPEGDGDLLHHSSNEKVQRLMRVVDRLPALTGYVAPPPSTDSAVARYDAWQRESEERRRKLSGD